MRDKSRRTLVLLAATVMAVTAALPGAVSPVHRPGSPVAETAPDAVRTLAGEAHAAAGEARGTSAGPQPGSSESAATVPGAASERADDAPAVEDATDGSDPATWVASVDILGVGDAPPEPPSDGTCPRSTSCDRKVIRTQKWKTAEDGTLDIAWRFNDEGRRNLRAPTGLLEGSVRRSMAEWSRWNSNIVFRYDGTTTKLFGARGEDGSCADGTNVVGWHRFDPSVIAAVYTCIDPKTNVVQDADLALNVTQHWENIRGEPESRHTFDIDSIVTHEIGHWLSLLDLYAADALHQTMMGNAEYGETRKRTLALGDIVGVQTAYPCDATDVCPREGIVDD